MYVPPFFHRLRQFVAGRFPTLSILRQFFATGIPKCVARRGSAQSIPAASEAHPISTFALLGGGNCPVCGRDDMRRLRGLLGFHIGRATRRSVGLDGRMAGTDRPRDSEANSTALATTT